MADLTENENVNRFVRKIRAQGFSVLLADRIESKGALILKLLVKDGSKNYTHIMIEVYPHGFDVFHNGRDTNNMDDDVSMIIEKLTDRRNNDRDAMQGAIDALSQNKTFPADIECAKNLLKTSLAA